jgi:hypothetical protein
MRQYLTLLFVALIVPPALADDMKTPNSKTIVMCFEQQSLGAICTSPAPRGRSLSQISGTRSISALLIAGSKTHASNAKHAS